MYWSHGAIANREEVVAMRCLIVLIMFAVSMWAQDSAPHYALHISGSKDTGEKVKGLFMPLRCDADGKIYLRFVNRTENPRVALRSLKRINPKEAKVDAVYSFDGSQDIQDLEPYDFAVTPDGGVFATAASKDAVYVVQFDKDGKFKRKTKLDRVIKPTQLAALESGSFIVSGLTLPTKEQSAVSFAGLFDSSGRLLKQITLQDEHSDKSPQDIRVQTGDADNPAIELGIAVSAGDKAYLLRRSSPAVIHEIDSTGQVSRSLRISAGPGAFYPDSVLVRGGNLFVLFSDGVEHFFKEVDGQTGETMAEFHSNADLGAAAACYDGTEFSFINSNGGLLDITTAKP